MLKGSHALEQDGVEFVDVTPVELGEVVSVVKFSRALMSRQRGEYLRGDGKALEGVEGVAVAGGCPFGVGLLVCRGSDLDAKVASK